MRNKLGFAMKYVAAGVLTVGLGVMAGCADGAAAGTNSTSTPPVTSGKAASTVYLTAPSAGTAIASQVVAFSATSSGTATPTATITLPVPFSPQAIAVDGTGQIYVSGFQGGLADTNPVAILVYAAGATGTATPVRTITPVASDFLYVKAMRFDTAGNLYVASWNSAQNGSSSGGTIAVFAPNATGAATPTRLITGTNAGLAADAPTGMAVDGTGTIYMIPDVASTSIQAFSSSATGNVAPTRTIGGSSTGLIRYRTFSLAVDGSGNLYAPVNDYASKTSSVLVFSATASGNVAPIRTIAGTATGLISVYDMAADAAGNVYVAQTTALQQNAVTVFPASANGNVAPTNTFTSSAQATNAYNRIALY